MSLINGSITGYQGSGAGITANVAAPFTSGSSRLTATGSTDQVIGGGVGGTITWNEIVRVGGDISDNTGGVFLINTGGIYLLNTMVFTNSAYNSVFQVNNATLTPNTSIENNGNGAYSMLRVVALNSGDLVKVVCTNNTTVYKNLYGDTRRSSFFEIVRLS